MFCKKIRRCKKRIWGLSNLRLCGFFFVCLGIIFAAACRTDPVRCEDPLGCVVIHPSSPVRLASLLPISGETAVWGEEFTRGINLAISERGGELLGHDIEIVQLDSGCDAAGGQQAVQSLSDDDSLLAVIGPACSDVA